VPTDGANLQEHEGRKEGIGRVFFCTLVGRRAVILHDFINKTCPAR
jgi:phage-related protein